MGKNDMEKNDRKVLLLSCCAPCSGAVLETLLAEGEEVAVFFFNPNIHPFEEYRKRRDENRRFAENLGIDFIEGDYRPKPWFEVIVGLEQEPERGRRCSACFAYRLQVAARLAAERGFNRLASCLGISRWKDLAQVDECGRQAVDPYPDLHYWGRNWRKAGGAQRMMEVSRREGFYQQQYCGCIYSLEATNRRRWRLSAEEW